MRFARTRANETQIRAWLCFTPVGEENGGSSGLANAQPVCSSFGSSGRVRCQVGCVTDRPITSCRPCAPAYVLRDALPPTCWSRGSRSYCGALLHILDIKVLALQCARQVVRTFRLRTARHRFAQGHASEMYR